MICSQESVELNLVNTPWRAGGKDGFMCTHQPVAAVLLRLLNDSWFIVHTETCWSGSSRTPDTSWIIPTGGLRTDAPHCLQGSAFLR